MVREPDFVYGIVPALGEYGFEIKPSDVDSRVWTRVQGLASSLEWTGHAGPDPIAIALDPVAPPLVAQFATDPRDPDGRISLSLKVWIVGDDVSASRLIDALWPEQGLSVSKEQFLGGSGRRIAGPEKSFIASGFEYAWGAPLPKSNITGYPSRISRPIERRESARGGGSTRVLTMTTVLMTVLSIFLGVWCFQLYLERNQNNDAAVRYEKERDAAQEQLDAVQEDVAEQNREHEREIETLSVDKEELGNRNKDLETEVARLKDVIRGDTAKVERVEMEELRALSRAVRQNLETIQDSLDRIRRASPKESTWLNDPFEKARRLLPGSANDK